MNGGFFIPPWLKRHPNFVLWRLAVDASGRQRKVPFSAQGRMASVSDSATWTTHETAMQALKAGGFDGLGYVFDEGAVFIDLDGCIDGNGDMTPLAQNVVDNFRDTFIELSQSKRGIHILALGSIPRAIKTKNVEMYGTKRFVALTGDAINALDLKNAQERIDRLFRYCQRMRGGQEQAQPRLPQCELLLPDSEVIEKACRSRNGDVFRDLLAGNWKHLKIGDGTQSSADLRFCNSLAFWCRCDADAMCRIFRSSRLFRNERKMWLAINRAIKDCRDVYKGGCKNEQR